LVAAAFLGLLAPLALAGAGGSAQAQTPPGPPPQVALTETQIQSYLLAEKEFDPILAKLPPDAPPDAKVVAQLDTIAKKYKFASFEDFNAVGASIGLVADGIDPQTKKYVGEDVVLKKQIADITANKSMPAADKKAALDEMNQALKSVEPVKFPGNIALVVKFYDQIVAAEPPPPPN
jgi:hypothetical protein